MKKLTICISLLFSFLLTSEVLAAEEIPVYKNKMQVFVNNTQISQDNFLYNDSLYLPLRAVSEATGASVSYNDIFGVVSIQSAPSSLEYEQLYRNFQILLYSKKINDSINSIVSLADTTTIELYSALNNSNGLTLMETFDNVVQEAIITYNKIYDLELIELYEAASHLQTVAVSLNNYGNLLTDLRFSRTTVKNAIEQKDITFAKMYEAKLKAFICVDDIVLAISNI